MSDNIIRGRFAGPVQRRPHRDSADYEATRHRRQAQAMEIRRRIEGLRNGKIANLEDRVTIARNLGRILERHRRKRGAISELLRRCGLASAGDYTKHLPRYAIFPDDNKRGADGKSLAARFDPYRKLAIEAADKREGNDGADEILIELVDGTSLDGRGDTASTPVMADRALAESMGPLLDMLNAIAERVARGCDLHQTFRTVARWNLCSGNGGYTVGIDDHPVGPKPTDPDFWLDRLDLVPLAQMFDLSYQDEPVAYGVWRNEGNGPEHRIQLKRNHGVWFGVAPTGSALMPTPVLVERVVIDLVSDRSPPVSPPDSAERNGAEPFTLFDNALYLEPSGADVSKPDQDVEAIALSESGGWWQGTLRITQTKSDLTTLFWTPPPRVERLTLPSLFEFLHGNRSAEEIDAVRESFGFLFQDATSAYPRTVAASIERALRATPEDDAQRLDNRLLSVARRAAAAVREGASDVERYLAESTREFIERQSLLAQITKE